ncbi:MAG: hypothetical protein ABI162_09685 [Luteolibacter sp.]
MMENDPNKIPENHAQAWLRIILWILPTGFAWMSGVGLSLLAARGGSWGAAPVIFPIWIVLNCAFIVGAGRFHRMLSPQTTNDPEMHLGHVVTFFAVQLLLIPFLSLFVVFVICKANPIRF